MKISHVWLNAALAFGFGLAGAMTLSSVSRVENDIDQLVHEMSPPVTVHETRKGGFDGKTLFIDVHATRHRDCRFSVSNQFELEGGSVISRTNPNRITLAGGETSWLRIPVTVPPDVPAGHYRVRSTGEYICHDGRVFVVPTGWVDVRF